MGWVVFKNKVPRAWGCIRTEKTKVKVTRVSDDNAYCAGVIARGLNWVINRYRCKGLVGELPTGGSKGAKPANQMGIASGIVVCLATIKNIPAEWVIPGDVKKAATGSRRASKEKVMDAIRKRFPKCKFPKVDAEFEHIADACGVYLASEGSTLQELFG